MTPAPISSPSVTGPPSAEAAFIRFARSLRERAQPEPESVSADDSDLVARTGYFAVR